MRPRRVRRAPMLTLYRAWKPRPVGHALAQTQAGTVCGGIPIPATPEATGSRVWNPRADLGLRGTVCEIVGLLISIRTGV